MSSLEVAVPSVRDFFVFFVRLLLCISLQRIQLPKLVNFWTRALESLFLLAHGVNHLRRAFLPERRKYLLL